jgi:hypothetical protein
MLARTVRRYVIALSIVVVVVALYAAAGFWGVPHFLRSGADDFVSSHYKRKLSLGDIRFNPFKFTLDIADLSLPDSDGEPMVAFGQLHVDLAVISLLRLAPSFREIVLERPLVRTVVRRDGTLNLADLGKGFASEPPKTPPSQPMRLFIDRFAVIAGGGTFEDLSHATPFRAELKPIAFELSNFSTRAKANTGNGNEYSLTAASPEGERLDWNGTFLLQPLSSHGTFAIADLRASTIWSYLQEPLPLEIPSGVIAVEGEYNFDFSGDAPAIKVDVHDTTVSDLKLRPRNGTTDYIALGKLDVQETQVDLGKRAVEIGKVSLTGGEVNAWVSPQGQLNLLELTMPTVAAPGPGSGTPTSAANTPASATPVAPSGSGSGTPASAANMTAAATSVAPPGSGAGTSASAPAWTVSVPDISVDGFRVSAEDRQVTPALALVLNPINIHVAGFNTTPAARLDITARTSINGTGTLNATAKLSPSGGDVTAHVELAQLDLPIFQPIIAQRTAMTLQTGQLATQLDVQKSVDGTLTVKGDMGVSGLKTVDELKQSFIKWKDLRVAGLQYSSQPASLRIATITAREPYARVIIAPDRTVNVEEVLAGPSKNGPSLATQLGAANAKNGATIAGVKGGPPAKAAGADATAAGAEAANASGKAAAADAEAANASANAAAEGGQATGADMKAAAASVKAAGADATAGAADATAVAADAGAKLASATGAGATAADANAKLASVTAAGPKGAHRSRKARASAAGGGVSAAASQSASATMPLSIGTVRIVDGSVNYADFWIRPNFAVGIQTLNGTIEGLSSDPKSRAKVKLDGKVDRYAPVNIDGEMNLLAASVYSDIKMSFKGLELTTMTPYSGHFAGYKIDKGKLSVELSYKIDQRKLAAEQHFVIDQLQLGDKVDSPDAVHLPLKLAVALLKDRNGVIDLPLPITGSLDDPQFKLGPIIWHAVINLIVKAATAPFALIGRMFGGGGEEMKFIDFAAGSAALDDASKQKLDALTKALQEHTQLELDVPLVFSPALDRPVLAKRRLDEKLVARAHGDKPPRKQAAAASSIAAKATAQTTSSTAAKAIAQTTSSAAAKAIAQTTSSAAAQTTAQTAPSATAQVAPNAVPNAATPVANQPTDGAASPAQQAPALDPALADPLEHYRLLLAEYEADLGKGTPLPASALAIQSAKSKKDAPPVETAIPDLETALIGRIEVPDVDLQALGKKRTQAIQDVLLADGGIDASRVFIINGTAKTDDSGKVRVEMNLK